MFFELTNFLATFQTMINEILWNLINIGEVASFIDNIIVQTEKEEVLWYDVVRDSVFNIAVNNYIRYTTHCGLMLLETR